MVISNNVIERFSSGMYLDAGGGITGATMIVDQNVFGDCTTGINFPTASSEVRFTLTGHNTFRNCATNVASLAGGIARNGNPAIDSIGIIPVNVSTSGAETTAATALLSPPSANQILNANYRVSENGAFDGRIRFKDSAGATLSTDVFAELTNSIRSLGIPLVGSDLVTVSIEKSGAGPFTGSVSCNGLSFTLNTYY
jgi:hypothetical protein